MKIKGDPVSGADGIACYLLRFADSRRRFRSLQVLIRQPGVMFLLLADNVRHSATVGTRRHGLENL